MAVPNNHRELPKKLSSLALVFKNSKGFIAGTAAGVGGYFVGHPFDTLKVRLQTQVALPDGTMPFTGTVDCFTKTVRREGFLSLFKGLTPPVVGGTAASTLSMGTNAFIQRNIFNAGVSRSIHDLSFVELYACGGLSGFVTAFLMSPVEQVRILLQIQTQSRQEIAKARGDRTRIAKASQATIGALRYTGPLHCVSELVRESGVSGLYRGIGTMVLRSVVGYGIYFAGFEILCRAFTPKDQSVDSLPVRYQFLAGGLTGMIAWTVPFPFDVIKSRIQAQKYTPGPNGVLVPSQYAGFWDCVRKTLAKEGFGALYKGLTPALLRAFPTNATLWMVYQATMRYILDPIDNNICGP